MFLAICFNHQISLPANSTLSIQSTHSHLLKYYLQKLLEPFFLRKLKGYRLLTAITAGMQAKFPSRINPK